MRNAELLSKMEKGNVASGGVGHIVKCAYNNFVLKVVSLLNEDGTVNEGFWQEAKSVFSICAGVRFLPRLLKTPYPVCYWIHRRDSICCNDCYCGERGYDRRRCWDDCEESMRHDECYCGERGYDRRRRWDDCEESMRHDNSNKRLTLHDFISQLKVEVPNEMVYLSKDYILASPKQLQVIYEKKLSVDLLLVYPIEAGSISLADCQKTGKQLTGEQALVLTENILSGILSLYDSERAHCDIKPSNIMAWFHEDWMKEKLVVRCGFRLTDYGSVHSETLPSDSGTNGFFSKKTFDHLREKGKTVLECRTLMDGYALAQTLYTLVNRGMPARSRLVSSDLIQKLGGNELAEIFAALFDVENMTIDKMRKMHAKLSALLPEWAKDDFPIKCYLPMELDSRFAFPFEIMGNNYGGVKYGRMYEQIRFSDEFDPLMRISLLAFDSIPDELHLMMPKVILRISTGTGRYSFSPSYCILHAPDDSRTGKRPSSFTNYVPYSLANHKPSDAEQEQLLNMARNCNKVKAFIKRLPAAEDIVRIDGQWKILWFLASGPCQTDTDFARYFQSLWEDNDKKRF